MESTHQMVESLTSLRERLGLAFSPDTALQRVNRTELSSGHCATVSAIVYLEFGGELVSTVVEGQSHWLNRISISGEVFDIDLTGDQFGLPKVQIGPVGQLYSNTRPRRYEELSQETLERTCLLASRAGLLEVAKRIKIRN